MIRHYCNEERCWLDFEEVCSWCGMTEEGARQLHGMTSDAEFRELMRKMEANARPDINDD